MSKFIALTAAGVVTLCAAVAVGLVVLLGSSTGDPQEVSDQFVVALQNGDGEAAYKLAGPSLRALANKPELTKYARGMATVVTKRKRAPSAKAISSSTKNGKIAVFTYTMPAYQAMTFYWKVQLREEDDGWQVMNFRSSDKRLGTDVEL